jgi:hypothetical protein
MGGEILRRPEGLLQDDNIGEGIASQVRKGSRDVALLYLYDDKLL